MKIIQIAVNESYWSKLMEYSDNCSWEAGKKLSRIMRECAFSDWETVFAAIDKETIVGYCTLTKTDCMPNRKYSPYIGFVFVDETYRGNRISEKMINIAADYAKTHGFESVYIASSHEKLYEKYGFDMIDEMVDVYGHTEKIFVRSNG